MTGDRPDIGSAGPAADGAAVSAADREHAVSVRLHQAELEPLGRFADASNATLLVRLADRDERSWSQLVADLGREPGIDDLDPADLAVYKPRRGEAPLWDFPEGTLHRREVAAYEVSAALGWGLVPLTVLREDAPYGVGSVQRFVPHDLDLHYFRLREIGTDDVIDDLRRMVLFDLVIDNADRKGGHVLFERSTPMGPGSAGQPDRDPISELALDPISELALDASTAGRVRVVDHGVSLNVEPKLRTVAWDFAGRPIPDYPRDEIASLATALDGDLGARLDGLLSRAELVALRERIERVASSRSFPSPEGPRSYPWPPL